jgi:FkbM family methyltransferase
MSIISTRYGKMRIIEADNVVSHALTLYGEWAQDELRLLERIIVPGMCVLDIGAFIGTHTLAFSEFVGQRGSVYSFEPRKEIFTILSENMSLNNCGNVTALNMGLAEKEQTLNLRSLDISEGINFGGLALDEHVSSLNDNTYQVHVSTIDSLDIAKIDVLKLDVEGMERKVLDGAIRTILRDRPVIFCECNSLVAGNEILVFCEAVGYETYGFLAFAYNPNNFNATTENFFGTAKELALVLLPQEKHVEILKQLTGTNLVPIKNLEDLVLPLLHKPQYAYEVLAHTAPNSLLGIDFPSPSLSERDGQITNLNQAVAERDEYIVHLNQGITYRDGQITNLSQAVAERDSQIANFNQAVAERDGQITNLNQAVAERDEYIAHLNQGITYRDGQITNLSQAIAERDIYTQRLINSKSWLITKPIRWVGRVGRGDFIAALAPIKKRLRLGNTPLSTSRIAAEPNSTLSDSFIVTASPIKCTHPVSVILPVYRGVEMTKGCILAAMPSILAIPNAHIVVINDASPDVGMQEMLEALADQYPNVMVLLKNEENLGFVGTVNRGLAYFSQHDAVLLNSDVIVPQDWLSRLVDEAYSRANIGTVTPFSNNATICSFPHFLQENPQPFDLDVNSIDAVFRATKLPCIQAPTGVGFCMYIRRDCLNQIGYLNQEKFGKGYGEENDLCQRALKSGWLNIISPNIYAYHQGAVSFSSDKQALVDRAMQVIEELHPNYHTDVQKFIQHDPLKNVRIARYIQLLSITPIPKVLHISHAIGGGVGQHIEELAQYFDPHIAHILLTPHGKNGSVSISFDIDNSCDKLIFNMPDEYFSMLELLKAVCISAVHFHHTIGLDAKILDLPRDLDVTYLLSVHDYYWMDANPTLTDATGKYSCGYSGTQHNPLYPFPKGITLDVWQARLRPLIEGADCVIFPSNAAKIIFNNVYQPSNAVVAPHIEARLNVNRMPCIFTKKNQYTIGVLGAVSREKGADLLEDIAVDSKSLGFALTFKLLGYAYKPLKALDATGPYRVHQLANLIQEHGLDIVFFPAQWPETYSYTLSFALDSGLPIIAPNIGAFPERLSGRQNVLIFDHLTPATELLNQINVFIQKLSVGARIFAPNFEGDKSKHDFYTNDYISIVARDLNVLDVKKTRPFELDFIQIISSSRGRKKSHREAALRVLWSLYMNPSFRWFNHAIPYVVRRFIKRSLSHSAIHDITNHK